MTESALAFDCRGATLVGILHRPEVPRPRGVVIVVGGGPQYRAGGHRQLTLWSRMLARHGVPVLRFDYRGMGDSQGEFRGFECIGEDIGAAIDELVRALPGVREVVLWGECDAASAILFHAADDPRVKGVVLLNPWARTESGQAHTLLRHYYLQRLLQPSFWRKLLSLQFDVAASMRSAWSLLRQAVAGPPSAPTRTAATPAAASAAAPLPQRLLDGLHRFHGPVLLVLSGRDLIAAEFQRMAASSRAWRRELARPGVTRHLLPEGDHTFSSAAQRDQVAQWGLAWLNSW